MKRFGSTEMIKIIEYHKHIFTNIQETHIIVLVTVLESEIGHMWPCLYILEGGLISYVEPYDSLTFLSFGLASEVPKLTHYGVV